MENNAGFHDRYGELLLPGVHVGEGVATTGKCGESVGGGLFVATLKAASASLVVVI